MAGKDVYVEKPASHNILEGKTAVAAARKHERMVQMGTQIRSAPFLRQARAYIDSGAMGKVIYGKAWETDRNPSVHLSADSAPPKGIDYDIWQGPAPERPYNATIVGGAWRWLFDYGTGDLGNDGVHRIDYCRYLMGLDEMPEAVCCSGGKFFFEDDQQWPDTMLVNYEYPGKVLQYEMRLWSMPKLFDATEGAVVYGENGWMLVTNTSWKAYDADGKPAKDATRIPMKVGDVLQINDRRAVVVGLCQVSRTFQSQPVIYTTYSRALSYAPPERKQLSLILAKAVHGVDHGELAQRVTASTNLRARTKAQMSWDTVMYYVKNTGIVINFGIAVLLGFLVGVAIAGQTFYNFTLDNLRYFGALKAMGGSNWLLLRMVLLQALLAGVVGYGLGVGAAALFGMRVQGTELAFRMTWHIPAISAAAVALICALSSIVSMIKVIRLEPAVVFRG